MKIVKRPYRPILLISASILLTVLSQSGKAAESGVSEPHPSWNFREAGLIPVQVGGRVKPLDSFARDLVLYQTGSRSFEGWDPVDLAFSWISSPTAWEQKEFIKIQREDVKKQLGLDPKRSRFSPKELFEDSYLAQYANEISRQGAMPGVKLSPRDQELRRTLDKLGAFRGIVSGDGWPLIPASTSMGQWKSIAAASATEGGEIKNSFSELIQSYIAGDGERFLRASRLVRAAVEGSIPGIDQTLKNKIATEGFYNRSRPFFWSWAFYLFAGVLWIVATRSSKRKSTLALAITAVAAFFQIAGIAMRCYIAGRPPVTNMYESIIWVTLGVIFFASILYFYQRQAVLFAVASIVSGLGLIAADLAPAMMDPGIHPLVPVLRSNYWLTVHVLTITLSYAAFALSFGLGNVSLFHFLKKGTKSSEKISLLNQLMYRSLQFGVVLVAAGTILGGIWADYSWGRFWGWDPKEVWALIVLLAYIAVLHGRYAGWVGQFGFAAWTVISFLSVIMAWYGVNFVLGVGLHSYGFSSGGQGWVAVFVLIELAYVAWVAVKKKKLLRA